LDRLEQLQHWLNEVLSSQQYELTTASADASFRRYFRATLSNDESYIVMDAPPDKEDSHPFVRVATLFEQAGIPVPKIFAQDLAQGFLLLSDFGNTTLLMQLQAAEQTPQVIDAYLKAIQILVEMQLASREDELPAYDEALLMREMRLFDEWYVGKHLQLTLSEDQQKVLDGTYQTLLKNILAQPKGYVHRDYHSRNLMVKSDGNLGVLDFQDAVYGALTYDLVSLLKDAYISWDEELILDLTVRYWQLAKQRGLPVPHDFADFYRDFEWMGAQRHIKVLGIFARLYHRDGKAAYLNDMPLVMNYLQSVCARYIELAPLFKLLGQLDNKPVQTGYTF
jgi:aminoglycoside/choline kinase family phosphotransferase